MVALIVYNNEVFNKRSYPFFAHIQAEEEMMGKDRKIKLLEDDLDRAEERYANSDAQLKSLTTEVEELKRDNQKLQRELESLDGKETHSHTCIQIDTHTCINVYKML